MTADGGRIFFSPRPPPRLEVKPFYPNPTPTPSEKIPDDRPTPCPTNARRSSALAFPINRLYSHRVPPSRGIVGRSSRYSLAAATFGQEQFLEATEKEGLGGGGGLDLCKEISALGASLHEVQQKVGLLFDEFFPAF